MRQQQRQLDVALGGERGQQVVELENEADVPRAPGGELTVGELVHAVLADLDGAGGRPVESADQVEQGGLARTGRPHQREEFRLLHFQVETG